MRRVASIAGVALLLVGLGACTTTTTSGTTDSTSAIPNDLLHDRGRAATAIEGIEGAVGATPARVTEVDVYPEYLITEVQDPAIPDHIDRYEWRDGEVPTPEPVSLSGPQEDVEASLFPTSAVNWRQLPSMVADAERAALHNKPLRIEQPRASYVTVDRSTSPTDDGRVLIRIYISGPRRSGYVEMDASGAIRSVNVN
ncbi:MAG: hypothetical protein MUP67_01015 [Acidimicrobiia bacterium]|nr:hypothetical protein [Acidimicrobiia bacterium]